MSSERNTKLLEIHKKLLDLVDNNITQSLHDTKIESDFFIDIFFLLAKSTKTFRAIHLLCDKGYGEDAIILTRSLLENLISFAYISQPQSDEEKEHRAKLFRGWLIIDFRRKIKKLKDADPLKPQLEQSLKEIDLNGNIYANVNKLHQEECQKLKESGKQLNKWSWSCLSLKDMANEIGLLDPYYNKVYSFYSQIAHPHPGGSIPYRKLSPNGKEVLIYDAPSSELVEEALVSSFDCYFKIVELTIRIFNLNPNKKMEEIGIECATLVKTL